MTADSGTSNYFIDNQLRHGIEQKMIIFVRVNPPVTINIAGKHDGLGVGKRVLVDVPDQISKHPARFPFTIVPGLGRHLFSGGTAAT